MQVKALVAEGLEVDWRVTIQHEGPGRAAYTAAALRGVGVTHVIVGSEPGVSLHAELSSYFADSPVPAEKIELRRNKYLQSEAVRAAGIDAVQQTLAHTREDVEEFIRKVERSGAAAFKAVIKPVEGAGSDGSSICNPNPHPHPHPHATPEPNPHPHPNPRPGVSICNSAEEARAPFLTYPEPSP